MGSNQKARELLEVSQAHMHYSTIVDYALTYFIAKGEKEGNPIVDELKKLKQQYKQEFEKAIEMTEEVYAEIFSDEEMDELIVIYTNPTIEKLRGLTSEIFNRVLEKYALKTG